MSVMFFVVSGISIVIFFTILIIAIVSISKNKNKWEKMNQEDVKKLEGEDKPEDIFTSLGKRIKESVEEFANPNLVCPYCKSTYSRKEKKCPSCGAGKPKK